MLLSRGVPLLRNVLLKSTKPSAGHRVTSVRHSADSYQYRNEGSPAGSAAIDRAADICYTFFWFWVGYHFITKYDHITGEYDWPDAASWTDEELGVPPDDYEPPNRT